MSNPVEQPQKRSRRTIGLLTYGAGDPNSQAVWEGVQSAGREHGASVICYPGKPLRSPHGFEAQSNIIFDLVGPDNVDGLVIWTGALCHRVDMPAITEFCRRYFPLPIVTLGDPPVAGIPGVTLDNYQGMLDVLTHLVEFHNLSRIAFIRGPEPQPEAQQRYQAYIDVLAQHNIPFDPALVALGDFRESGGAAAAQVLVEERKVPFDALVAAADNMALGAMRALQRCGIRVPGDVAVAGFNDEVQGRFITPPLTTVPFRSYQMARRAAEMLLSLLDGNPVAERVSLSTRLLVRQSCGCPDPLVSEVTQTPARTLDRPLAVALDERRGSVLANMAACWEVALESAPTSQLDGTVDAFAEEMAGRAPGAFLKGFAEILQEALDAGSSISLWQSAVSVLRRDSLHYLRDRSALLRAESLFEQARIMIGETGQRAQAYQALQAQQEARILAGIGQSLGNAVSPADLEQAILEALPTLGIRRAYLSLYEDPAVPAGNTRLIMSCDENGPHGAELQDRTFASPQLTPSGVPADRRCDLVVEPLFYRNDQLGFVVFEAEPHLEEACEILRDQIAGAIKRSELYQQAEQARRVAEEGQRLAEEANLLKSRFLSTVSHELRTPLSLIVGTIEMLLRERPGPHAEQLFPYDRDLRSIRTGAQHLARLIGDVLDLASSQAGELRLTGEAIHLGEALTQITTLGEAMAREKGLSWESHIPEDLPTVWGDRTRLQQVVLNVLGNAVKFTEEGYVRLWAEGGNQQVVVAVTDSGMGIPAAEQEFIFDEFRQSERAARRGYGGMGLGLAISRRIVELHGGTIGVLSTGTDGAGSTFYFTLPTLQTGAGSADAGEDPNGKHLSFAGQIDANEAPGGLSPNEGQGSAFAFEVLAKPVTASELAQVLARQGFGATLCHTSRTILVVDDDPGILDLHVRLLEELDPKCRILMASGGQEALSMMAGERIDLILLDLMMPVVDGFAVLEAMRESESNREIPVIVLTAQILTGQEMARLQQRVAAVLSKGVFTGAEVLALVADALGRGKRLGGEAQRVVRQAMAYIHEHYAEPFSREKLAHAIGLSDRYLTQCFHAETGITPIDYVNRYRIRQARGLLERGEMSITDVALAVGFSDPSYFARVFRSEVGVSPRAYLHGERSAANAEPLDTMVP